MDPAQEPPSEVVFVCWASMAPHTRGPAHPNDPKDPQGHPSATGTRGLVKWHQYVGVLGSRHSLQTISLDPWWSNLASGGHLGGRAGPYRYLCTNVLSTVLGVLKLFLVLDTMGGSMCTDGRCSGLEGQPKAPPPVGGGHEVTPQR